MIKKEAIKFLNKANEQSSRNDGFIDYVIVLFVFDNLFSEYPFINRTSYEQKARAACSESNIRDCNLKTIIELIESIPEELLNQSLFSEIMKKKCFISQFNHFSNEVTYTYSELGERKTKIINVFELANKCKDWALEKGFCLMSCKHQEESFICEILTPCLYSSSLFNELQKTMEDKTEYHVIFNACKFIYEKAQK